MANFELKSPTPTGASKADVENFALEISKVLEFEIGAPLEPVVQELGGKFDFGWSADEANGGSIVVSPDGTFSINLSAFTSPTRDRFTIAHELGHYFLHFPKIRGENSNFGMRATRQVDPSDPIQERAEWEANWFAASFLMPATQFLEAAKVSTEYAAAKFNVSVKAAHVRKASLT